MVVYTIGAAFLPICYITDLATFVPGSPPTVPPWLTQTSDIVWMLCVSFITMFTPRDRPLRMTTELVSDVEEQKGLK